MQLPELINGRIINRYKRFLADVVLESGETITVHCPNTGSMRSCWQVDAPVQLSVSDDPKRKYPHTLERVDMGAGWVGVNTMRVNPVVCEGIRAGAVESLKGYASLKTEPRFDAEGHPGSRFDAMLLDDDESPQAYVEIKNTTLFEEGVIRFPDAVTERGRKHLKLLEVAVERGYRAAIVFAVNRPEGEWFEAAAQIDPEYADTLEDVCENGVEAVVVRLVHDEQSIRVGGSNVWTQTTT